MKAYRESQPILNKFIAEGNNKCLKKIVEGVDQDLCGKGYNIIRDKLTNTSPLGLSEKKQTEVSGPDDLSPKIIKAVAEDYLDRELEVLNGLIRK